MVVVEPNHNKPQAQATKHTPQDLSAGAEGRRKNRTRTLSLPLIYPPAQRPSATRDGRRFNSIPNIKTQNYKQGPTKPKH